MTVDAPAFQALFDAARESVFRLETRQTYAIPADDVELIAFRTGAPRPERSVRTSPWLRRIAVTTANGVSWSRVRVVEHPLTEYTRFELVAFVESQAAGEQVRLTDNAAPTEDFWLIDGRTNLPVGVWMRYDEHGNLLARERVTDRSMLASLADVQDSTWEAATPLNVWLAAA